MFFKNFSESYSLFHLLLKRSKNNLPAGPWSMILYNLNNGINTSPINLRPWVQVRQIKSSFLTSHEAIFIDILLSEEYSILKHLKNASKSGRNILDSARETLVLLWIIILQTNLQLYCLQEFPFLILRVLEHGIYTLVKSVTWDLRSAIRMKWNARADSSLQL